MQILEASASLGHTPRAQVCSDLMLEAAFGRITDQHIGDRFGRPLVFQAYSKRIADVLIRA